jgi:hypothetical protein
LFFNVPTIPDGVEIKDPSRMTTEPITKCLAHWLELEGSGLPAFKFIKFWSESVGDCMEAKERTVKCIPGPEVDAQRPKQSKGKGRARDEPQERKPAGRINGPEVNAQQPKQSKGKGRAREEPQERNPASRINIQHDQPKKVED